MEILRYDSYFSKLNACPVTSTSKKVPYVDFRIIVYIFKSSGEKVAFSLPRLSLMKNVYMSMLTIKIIHRL